MDLENAPHIWFNKAKRKKIENFFIESDAKAEMKNRETLWTMNNVDLDKILIEWIY